MTSIQRTGAQTSKGTDARQKLIFEELVHHSASTKTAKIPERGDDKETFKTINGAYNLEVQPFR
ncbi:hypothetical protein M378DRAFT_266794 [Amanita muscaria Koide BX008]|uniref:Uncharacterized protein n=1 Tax=Amanita muscaria (strain Koide BX008) TaxID=946122 RepID=A0A0C2TKR2_AMAMK|nr:hypothetical protein M378DRAFT_266794 [Amanita muscaria Koide BX008]